MPELGSSGSVRGALRNERPYRERYSAGPPINIFQPKLGDFARPHAEANQHGQYREVA
jgi:hypothetical protein